MDFKNIINTSSYDFLRNDINLKDRIILLVVGGSYGYGLNMETSDIDLRGIAVERKEVLLGLDNFDNFDIFEDKHTDTSIYSLKKIFNLLTKCNPNVIEILGSDPNNIVLITPSGKKILENINIFLSQKAIASFGGYSSNQLRRLQNSLIVDSGQDLKEEQLLKTLKSQMINLQERYPTFNMDFEILNSEKPDFEKEICFNANFKNYPVRDIENIFSEISNTIKMYGKLNNRNKKKNEDSLYKHGMHSIRVLQMGTEILEGKGVLTKRTANREFLLNIRNKKISFDEIFTILDSLEKDFQYAAKNTTLPKEPNYKEVQDLLLDIYKDFNFGG